MVLEIQNLRELDAQGLLKGDLRTLAIELVAERVRALTHDIQYKVQRRGEMIELLDDLRFGAIQPLRLAKPRRGVA